MLRYPFFFYVAFFLVIAASVRGHLFSITKTLTYGHFDHKFIVFSSFFLVFRPSLLFPLSYLPQLSFFTSFLALLFRVLEFLKEGFSFVLWGDLFFHFQLQVFLSLLKRHEFQVLNEFFSLRQVHGKTLQIKQLSP